MLKSWKNIAIIFGVAIVLALGLSAININMLQNQKTLVETSVVSTVVSEQHNTQLTILNTHMQIDTIDWRMTNFDSLDNYLFFLNTELDLFQQIHVSMYGNTIIYPVINATDHDVFTNSLVSSNYSEVINANTNEIDLKLFERVKNWFK